MNKESFVGQAPRSSLDDWGETNWYFSFSLRNVMQKIISSFHCQNNI